MSPPPSSLCTTFVLFDSDFKLLFSSSLVQPYGVALDPETDEIYISDLGAGTISAVSLQTLQGRVLLARNVNFSSGTLLFYLFSDFFVVDINSPLHARTPTGLYYSGNILYFSEYYTALRFWGKPFDDPNTIGTFWSSPDDT